jgi:hypothetical protein
MLQKSINLNAISPNLSRAFFTSETAVHSSCIKWFHCANSPNFSLLSYSTEISVFKTISQLMSDEKRAENVLNELENIDQDGTCHHLSVRANLTRAAGDHLITKEEIVAFCEKNPEALSVLGVESVDALMGKFDEDGSGQLDDDELKQLRAYINEKRKENQAKIIKLQQAVGNRAPIGV